MAKETKDLESTIKKRTKKAVSIEKKADAGEKNNIKKVLNSLKKSITKKDSDIDKKSTTKKDSGADKKSATKKSSNTAKKTTTKKSSDTDKKTATKKSSDSDKKTTTKKSSDTDKKTATKKSSDSTKKAATKKSSDTAKKTATKKSSDSDKKATTKKSSDTTKKTAAKKSSTSTKSSAKTNKTTSLAVKKTSSRKSIDTAEPILSTSKFQAEYYDLPFMYNKTVVKVLAQTPKMLFIYWEISEDDRILFQKLYGNDFFNNTKPVLIVYNDTLNYSFEVEIDDFANSWYLHINDANCEYHIELGRKPKNHNIQNSNSIYIPYYVYVTSSNQMVSPNNTILFNPNIKTVKFRNVKTGEIIEKDIMQFVFITNYGIFNVKSLYNYLFPNESFEFENIVLGNTSSGALSSSGMFSSQFK